MKAVWFTRQGAAAEVLQFGDQPTPHAGPGEVRVRLHASGVNPADIYRRAGRNYAMEGPLVIPNSDGSGVVDEIGVGAWMPRGWAGGYGLYNGQRGGRLAGTAAEYVALDAALADHVVDVDFGGNLQTLLPLLAANGSIAYYASRNAVPAFPAAAAMRRNVSIHGVLLNGAPLAARRRAQADISRWLNEGGMIHTLSSVHPLPRTADAHLAVESGTKLGTVVVDCTALDARH